MKKPKPKKPVKYRVLIDDTHYRKLIATVAELSNQIEVNVKKLMKLGIKIETKVDTKVLCDSIEKNIKVRKYKNKTVYAI